MGWWASQLQGFQTVLGEDIHIFLSAPPKLWDNLGSSKIGLQGPQMVPKNVSVISIPPVGIGEPHKPWKQTFEGPSLDFTHKLGSHQFQTRI